MNGIIVDAKLAYKRKVKVNPVEHHYEEPGEAPYIKYSCPVCTAVGNDRVSVAEGSGHCPLCGVSLNWERKPRVGDRVKITNLKSQNILDAGKLKMGDIGIITEDYSKDPAYLYPYHVQLEGHKDMFDAFLTKQSFSVLEEDC